MLGASVADGKVLKMVILYDQTSPEVHLDKLAASVTCLDQMPVINSLPRRVSLVTQTIESIRANLHAGLWRERLPAERELCSQLQVSRPTLRAALHELQRTGIISLVGRRRRTAPAPRTPRADTAPSRMIVILAPRPMEAMPSTAVLLFATLRNALVNAGFAVELRVDRACFSENPGRALEKRLQENPAAVWVAFGSREAMQRWFVQREVPLLVIGSCKPGIPLTSVDKDYRAVCRHAGDVLWRKGHRLLAIVMPQDAYDGDMESEEGFREALNQHDAVRPRVLLHNGSAAHLCALLDKALRSPAPPTGFLAMHPVDAITLLTHLMRRRLRVPEDVAILSRDDEPYLQRTSPVISRYAVSPDQIVRKVSQAVRKLAETGRAAPRAIRLIPKLILGETV